RQTAVALDLVNASERGALAPVQRLGFLFERGVGVRLDEERIADFVRRQRNHSSVERRYHWRRRSGPFVGSDGYQLERALLAGIDAEQRVHLAVDEAGQDARVEVEGRSAREEIGEQRARIPEQVPVATRFVLPGIAPVDGRGDEDGWRERHGLVGRGQ